METTIENIKTERYAAYKDSGVEWIGAIPEGWVAVKLKTFCSLKARIGFHGLNSNHFVKKGPFCITGTDFKAGKIDFKNCYHVDEYWYELDKNIQIQNGDVLVTKDGTIGKIAIIDNLKPSEKATLNSGVFVLRPKTHSREFYWQLNSDLFRVQVDLISRGSTINHLYERDFKEFRFIIPPLPEQTRIATFLDQKIALIDQAITQKEQLIELLKEHRQILIHNAVTRGLNPNVQMKDSGAEWIGEVPEHWEVTRVKNVFRLIVEPAPKNNDFELLSVYTDIGVKPRKELEERGNKASTTDGYWFVKKGDIVVNKLLAWMGAIGVSDYDGVTSPAYDILRAKSKIDSNYFHYLFRTKTCVSELRKHSRGIMDMRLRLYFDKFGDILIPCPEFEEQQKIVEFIEHKSVQIANAINLKEQEIEKIKEYKAILINSAVTGKIKV